jgi:ADP-ribosyl-[dinitrogen reductase] hydrolase
MSTSTAEVMGMTDSTAPQAREDQFLGALLGLAIGDALGRPLRGLSSAEIAGRYGMVDTYVPQESAGDGQPLLGEISDKTEVALCLVESLTTNDALLDPENINARLGFLAAGPSQDWMSAATVDGIRLAAEHDGLVPDDYTPDPELAVAVRGVPIGLVHAVGGFDEEVVMEETRIVSRLTHAGERQAQLTADVARAINVAGRDRRIVEIDPTPSFPERELLRSVLDTVRSAATFQKCVSSAIAFGGMTDSIGAVAGAIAGAGYGASGIPQHLIDGLDARIYLTLAAPWFYRTAVRRAGTVIDLRLIQ